jgi:hypothetical protein
MTTKRRPLNRSQGPAVTAEMVELFKRGRELQAAGHDDVDDDSAEHEEFVQIDRKLDSLLHRPWCGPSLFDPALDRARAPAYLRHDHDAYRCWPEAQRWGRALMEEVEMHMASRS